MNILLADADNHMRWPAGRAERLARRGLLRTSVVGGAVTVSLDALQALAQRRLPGGVVTLPTQGIRPSIIA
jgi:hypothetical protein